MPPTPPTPDRVALALRVERIARAVVSLRRMAESRHPVTAAEPPPPRYGIPEAILSEHEQARLLAERVYDKALRRYISAAEALALKKKRRQDEEDELIAYWLLLMQDASQQAYRVAGTHLSDTLNGQLGGGQGTGQPGGVQPQQPAGPQGGGGGQGGGQPGSPQGPTTPPTDGEAEDWGKERGKVLEPIGGEILTRLETTADEARQEGDTEDEVRGKVHQEGDDIETGRGKVIKETEAQTIYGHAQLRLLKEAGYTHKAWLSQRDNRVRPSHEKCDQQGPIPLAARFSNGLLYPGEEGAPPDEVVNCRCDLVGVYGWPRSAEPVQSREAALV